MRDIPNYVMNYKACYENIVVSLTGVGGWFLALESRGVRGDNISCHRPEKDMDAETCNRKQVHENFSPVYYVCLIAVSEVLYVVWDELFRMW